MRILPRRRPPPATSRVVGGLSPSRAGDFLDCPLLYRFRTIDRLAAPSSPDALRGTLVHQVLERIFDLPAAERTPQQARTMVEPTWKELLDRGEQSSRPVDLGQVDEQEWLESCEASVDRWFALEDPTRLEPAEREAFVEATLDSGLVLRGVIDRLDVAPDGALRVVDYKTGSAAPAGFEARALFQLRFYALVLWRARGVVARELRLVYLGSGEVLSYSPDEDELRATERKVLAIWDAIALARRTGDFQPSPGRVCGWCPHHDLCPVYGGTPPPLPPPLPPPVPPRRRGPTWRRWLWWRARSR